MTLRERIKAARRQRIIKAVIAEGLMVPSENRLRNGIRLFYRRGDFTLNNSELIFSAVSRISNALSAMPCRLYKGSTPIQSDLSDLISFAPNGSMTACNFFKTMEACRCTNGNCYGLKIFDMNMSLVRIDILDPVKVTPIIDTDTGELWYRISPEYPSQSGEYYIHNFYMIHIPFLSTNGFSGINPVSVLQDTLEYSENIQTFSRSQLDQGVNAAIVLEAPANLGETQKAEMVESFMQTYRETSGNILLLESGVTAKTMNLSPVDTKLFEVEKITRSKVAMVYNIPPHLLGDYSDTSFNSQEQQMLEFLMLTMLPIVTAYEAELDKKLLTKDERRRGYHFKFNMESVLRADSATRAEVNFKAIRSGYLLIDEVRADENRPPLPNGIGRKALVSQDLATLDYTVNQKADVLSGALKPQNE